MKVFVTGATGFLGSHLVNRLVEKGWDVVAHGRNPTALASLAARGVKTSDVDLEDVAAVQKSLRGCERVFHVAGLSSPWGTEEAFMRSNVVTTRTLVEACLREGKPRLIFTSSPSLYITNEDRLDIKETDPLPSRFVNTYAKTKYLAEQEILRGQERGLGAVRLRPQALVGAGDRAIFPRLVQANERGGVPVFRGGQALMDLTHVDNVVAAHILAAQAPNRVEGNAYNVTNGTPLPMRDILDLLFDALQTPLRKRALPYPLVYALAALSEAAHKSILKGREPTLTRYGVVVLARSRTLDISSARQELGYVPGPSVEEGIRAFAADWRKRDA
ncbi:MAG: NAD-dependent epimerase/dehydratase family protein [Silvanigrellales bacterium]|nr:NAD-dependent epimerase/dehydratase family protein [Silvanigrellales bacterium]